MISIGADTHPLHVIGVDIGGTKIKAGAVMIQPDGALCLSAVMWQMATPHVPPGTFYDVVVELIRRMQTQAQGHGLIVLPVVAVAHPGRFLPDGTLARGTTPNLGAHPHEFDHLNPAQELTQRLGGVVVAENDAVAQMRWSLVALLGDPSIRGELLGRTVVYVGPGTGMGGGVALISAQGNITPVTDGHFFDLEVPGYGDDRLTAEELFTGPAIARLVREANQRLKSPIEPATPEQLSRILADPQASAEHRQAAQHLVKQTGEILATLIETIHAGRITKIRVEAFADGPVTRDVDEPDRRWSAQDCDLVRGATRYILGGSIGADPALGGALCSRALEVLRQRALPEIRIMQSPVASADTGLLGVVWAVSRHMKPPMHVNIPGVVSYSTSTT